MLHASEQLGAQDSGKIAGLPGGRGSERRVS